MSANEQRQVRTDDLSFKPAPPNQGMAEGEQPSWAPPESQPEPTPTETRS